MFKALQDFIFPRVCLGCGSWGEYLCSDCLNFIRTNDHPICPVCAKPAVFGITHPSCRKPLSLDGLTSVFVYKGVLKRVIAKLKYQFVTDLAETILELFLTFCGEDKAFTKFVRQKDVCLVAVPLHWQRKNWRGFNQAELLGRMIAQKLGIAFNKDLLIRTKNSVPQVKLKKEERQVNVRGIFKMKNKSLFDTLIFDDVWTTGATMRECAKVLKRNGVRKVWGLTLAR